MNIYGNEITSRIYPDLNSTVPQEPQTYRLKQLTEIEAYLLNKIEVCKGISKKKKKRNNSIKS